MEILTNSNKEIPTLFDNAEYWLQVYFKLKDYEDLEERLNKIYGDCDGLLESMVELLEKHSVVDIPDDTVKVLLITNESVDFYKKCKSLEEQGRLLKLPCKVGDDVYYILGIPNETPCAIDKCTFELSDINKIGKTLFLTKSEAEAKLEELRGNQNEM